MSKDKSKVKLTPEEKKVRRKHRGKTAVKVICIVLACIVGLYGIGAIVNVIGVNAAKNLAASFDQVEYEDQLVPYTDEDGDWVFVTDGEFKIMQLTDIHIGGGFLSFSKDENALNAVAAMIQEEKPDLVVITGDLVYPVPFQSGTFNNKTSAEIVVELLETLGVYWTLTFGNHDTEAYSYYDREYMAEFYENGDYQYCLFTAGPDDVDGYGNQVIKVMNTDGVITQALFLFDSHSYTDGDIFGIAWKYDNIHDNQIEWYVERLEAMNEYNQEVLAELGLNDTGLETVKSLAFFHIPLAEYKTAWEEFAANGYEDTEDVQYNFGLLGETGRLVYSGMYDDNVFETFLEYGSTQAVFCGHDHYNNFSITYKGIELVYGYSVDYLAYIGINKEGSQRGCTIITTYTDGTYETEHYNLYSGRYTLPAGFSDNITMQFEEYSFQYTEDE